MLARFSRGAQDSDARSSSSFAGMGINQQKDCFLQREDKLLCTCFFSGRICFLCQVFASGWDNIVKIKNLSPKLVSQQ